MVSLITLLIKSPFATSGSTCKVSFLLNKEPRFAFLLSIFIAIVFSPIPGTFVKSSKRVCTASYCALSKPLAVVLALPKAWANSKPNSLLSAIAALLPTSKASSIVFSTKSLRVSKTFCSLVNKAFLAISICSSRVSLVDWEINCSSSLSAAPIVFDKLPNNSAK